MQKYHDSVIGTDGLPVVDGAVSVYEEGTLTLATIYSDNGVTETDNPITTDARGAFAFYAADGVYDLVVAKTGFGSVSIPGLLLDDQDTADSVAVSAIPGMSAENVQAALEELLGLVEALDTRVTALETP